MKKVLTTVIAGLGLVAMVGSASAATININLYGASAQYKFWNAAATPFLTAQGCTDVKKAQDTAKKQGITVGTCPNAAGGNDTVYIRYAAKASYDGIYSCKGEVAPGITAATAECPDYRQRKMADETKVGSWTTGGLTGTKCMDVNIGASDVAGDTFGQQSSGLTQGCNGASTVSITRDIPAISTEGMTATNPIVVPFGFFANTAVGENVTNLTRLQAVMLFSGNVWNWSDFGAAFPSKKPIICLRHAGSGTHATLNAAVMRGDNNLLVKQNCPYKVSFNDGSGDEMACINSNGGQSTSTYAAVGYADADALVGASATLPNVKALTYEGAAPTRSNIQNGVYSFWSAQWLYECDPSDEVVHPWVEALNNFASDDDNLVALGLGDFWCAQSSLNVIKDNDFALPTILH